ncbi:MAG: UvrD-helicase domain-containing protein [Planctomycetota bacterium]|jgi:ATP-dependent helicase/nuclease subunit A
MSGPLQATRRWTESQVRAIETRDRDVCVVAGAGSGKTSVLSARFAALVTDADCDLERLLALTFTEKAAVEMRERVAAIFREAGRRDLRFAVETAWIGTFHGFCARLLKENAVEAGVDPGFSVLSGLDQELLLEEACEAAVDRCLQSEPATLERLALIPAPGGDLATLLSMLLHRCRGFDVPVGEPFRRSAEPVDPTAARAALDAALADLSAESDGFTDKARERAHRVASAAADLDGSSDLRLLETANAVAGAVNLQAGRRPKELLSAVKEAARALAAVAAGRLAAPVAATLAELLDEMDRIYFDLKEERGGLDFSDLERRALDLLRENDEVREEVRARFDHVLVDEYQDTNPVQERLLSLVRSEGRQFVVGDPKQAIYGFRGADHRGFERALADAVSVEGDVHLRDSFRSRPGVLAFANEVLAPAFAGGGAAQVEYERLVPGVSFAEVEHPSVEVISVEGDGGVAALREVEAGHVADRLRSLLGEGGLTVSRVGDDGEPSGRPLRWGDAAILVRATASMKAYERALADRDIPYQVVQGGGFYEAREVVDLVRLLEAVENPRRELALAAVLRSPLAGLDDDALLALCDERGRRKNGNLADLLRGGARLSRVPAEGRARFRRFAEVFRRLRLLSRSGRLGDLVEAAVEETGYGRAVLLRRDGRQAAANLRKVVRRARRFEAEGAGGPADFARALRRMRVREERETEAPMAGDDAVSLLTVHQAKGLEWPLVVVPDAGRRPPAVSDPVLLVDGEAGLALRVGSDRVPTPQWDALKRERVARDGAESIRIFHVALTRAQEHVLVSYCRPGRGGAGPWMAAVEAAVDGASFPDREGETVVEVGDDATVPVLLRTVRAAGVTEARRRRSLYERRRRRFNAGRGPGGRVSHEERRAARTRLDALPGPPAPVDATPYLKTTSAELDREDDEREHWRRHVVGVPTRPALPLAEEPRRLLRPGDDDEHHREDGPGHAVSRRIRGVVVHAVLGTMDLVNDDLAAVRGQVTARLAEELQAPAPESVVDEVCGWIERFRATDLGRSVAEAAASRPQEVLREIAFLSRENGVLLRGQMDLLYRDAEGRWTVVDYKASKPPSRAGGRRRYERQVLRYARASERALGVDEVGHLVHYLED